MCYGEKRRFSNRYKKNYVGIFWLFCLKNNNLYLLTYAQMIERGKQVGGPFAPEGEHKIKVLLIGPVFYAA